VLEPVAVQRWAEQPVLEAITDRLGERWPYASDRLRHLLLRDFLVNGH
jgi:hypothetical protein